LRVLAAFTDARHTPASAMLPTHLWLRRVHKRCNIASCASRRVNVSYTLIDWYIDRLVPARWVRASWRAVCACMWSSITFSVPHFEERQVEEAKRGKDDQVLFLPLSSGVETLVASVPVLGLSSASGPVLAIVSAPQASSSAALQQKASCSSATEGFRTSRRERRERPSHQGKRGPKGPRRLVSQTDRQTDRQEDGV
jgi:hypothetical protein